LKGEIKMADMKMKRNGLGGYLLTLTPGQLKKWEHLTRETSTDGLIPNKKWDAVEYEISVKKDKYKVVVTTDQDAKQYTVQMTSLADEASTLSRTYRTWECQDNIMRMMLELHNAKLAADKAKKKQQGKKQA
jgi:hypothetical protein